MLDDQRARRCLYAAAVLWGLALVLLLGDTLLNARDNAVLDERGASVLGIWGMFFGLVAIAWSVFATAWVFSGHLTTLFGPVLREHKRLQKDGDRPPLRRVEEHRA